MSAQSVDLEFTFEGAPYWMRCDWSRIEFTDQNGMIAPTALRKDLLVAVGPKARALIGPNKDLRSDWFAMLVKIDASKDVFYAFGLDDHLAELERCKNPSAVLPDPACGLLNNSVLREWAIGASMARKLPFREAVFLGEGPFRRDDFASFALRWGLRAVPLHESGDAIVVLGRAGWLEEDVDWLIDSRVDKSLLIYSQEMLVAQVLTQRDPLASRDAVLDAFRSGHPGLEFVSAGWPGWVEAWVRPDRRSYQPRAEQDFGVDQSPLSVMGYRVGASGLPRSKRRDVLTRAFKGRLPQVGGPEYMSHWGAPGKPARLRRIAQHLVDLWASNARRANMDHAVGDWRADLAWLKGAFYKGSMQFAWPGR